MGPSFCDASRWKGQVCVMQECMSSGRQVAMATKFCTVAPDICGFSVWYSLASTLCRLEF